ncbi:glutathione S-transferase family protein [uncultured Alteromonas sp.]|uniref:glutathione S-transferase family protein n=1 Tax=uncultured Alteromonas sp. TaxID=179113 RepID=UPI0025E5544C|nr:glutathione S-transferase family protein [uncultured Alteromonas sp.]
MQTITLYASPGACSLVTLIALEYGSVAYEAKPVILAKGEHKQSHYMALNPKSKVPALQVGHRVITETPAILMWLHSQCKERPLFPQHVDQTQYLSDLSYLASGIHPLVTRCCRPDLLADEQATSVVKSKASLALELPLQQLDEHLAANNWWYGDTWSVLDAYWFWVIRRLSGCGYELSRFFNVSNYYQIMQSLDAVVRAVSKDESLQR